MWPLKDGSRSQSAGDQDLNDADVQKLFAELANDTRTQEPSSPSQSLASRKEEAAQVKILGEEPCSLQYYFDEFFMCYTPKSQLRNWYRYGEKKDCSERWKDFKWCMRTRMTDEDASQLMLKQRRVDMEKKIHDGPNSEDVWDYRTQPLQSPWDEASKLDVSIS